MNVISRGIRNAFRNGIRTFSIVVILGLSIGLALTMLVARQAVQAKIDSVKSSIGNIITVSPAGARGFQGGGEPLTADQIAKVKATPHVIGVTEILADRLDPTQTNLQSAIEAGSLGRRFNGGRGGGDFTPPVFVTGTNRLDGQALSGGGNINVTSGKTFDPSADTAVALVGKSLAAKNNLGVGSTFQAYGTTLTVSGIFDAGNNFSNSALVMPLATVQRLSQQTGDISSAIAQVDSISSLDPTAQAIKSQLGDAADVVSQQDTASQALAPLENIKTISIYSLVGAVIAGAAIILLTMMMIVRERRREIGVLKAIGASNIKVSTQFMTEAVTFTVMGAVVGLGLGAVGANPVTRILVDSSASAMRAGGGSRGGGFARLATLGGGVGNGLRNVTATVGWDIIFYGLGAAIIIAIIGSAIPAWIIAKVSPAEVMRVE